jgi:hypothetical protein
VVGVVVFSRGVVAQANNSHVARLITSVRVNSVEAQGVGSSAFTFKVAGLFAKPLKVVFRNGEDLTSALGVLLNVVEDVADRVTQFSPPVSTS